MRYIIISGRKYYFHSSHKTFDIARELAKQYKKDLAKCRYFIQGKEIGFWFPRRVYELYMTHFSAVLP